MVSQIEYRGVVFDCDGVLLDSNKLKTLAFKKVSEPFGAEASERLVTYHVKNGGISRYQKFRWFYEEVLGQPMREDEIASLVEQFGQLVKNGLEKCSITPALRDFKAFTGDIPWFVVSGSDQNELRDHFHNAGLESLFLGGVHGSPRTKFDICSELLADGSLTEPIVFFGDSKLDHEVAEYFGFDFVFVSAWTEFKGWEKYVELHCIKSVPFVVDYIDT